MIKAEIIADSKNEFGNRITTMVVTMPRIILAEFNTHRMFSRNSASNRAIPFEKMVKAVEENPFIPIAWQKDHKGMQGTEYFLQEGKNCEIDGNCLKNNWLGQRDNAIAVAKHMSDLECTKQLCNRLLEPFMWHTVIVTATEWENFFALRCPKYQVLDGTFYRSWKDVLKSVKDLDTTYKACLQADTLERLKHNKGQAEIHMMALAEAMWDAYNESTPKELKTGEWHIPFGDDLIKFNRFSLIEFAEKQWLNNSIKIDIDDVLIKIATARCARVSYTVVGEEGKEPNYENDIKLHDKLAESGHWSPFEHCARVMNEREYEASSVICLDNEITEENIPNYSQGWSGNFRGFIQYRKMFDNENIK